MSELTDDDSVSEVTGYHSQLISHRPSQPHHDKLQAEVVKIAFSFFFPFPFSQIRYKSVEPTENI